MTEFNTIFWRLRGVGFDPCTANFEAKFHPTTWRKVFRESDERFEKELAKKRGRCRECGAATKGLRVFCKEHVFTHKTGFDPHAYKLPAGGAGCPPEGHGGSPATHGNPGL